MGKTVDMNNRAAMRKAIFAEGLTIARSATLEDMRATLAEHGYNRAPTAQITAAQVEQALEQAEPAQAEPAQAEPAQAEPAQAALPATQADDLAASIAQTIKAAMQPQAQPLDESRIIELIQEHSAAPIMHNVVVTQAEKPTQTIEGAHTKLPLLLELVQDYPLTGVAPWLVGEAGSGKTTLAAQVAKSLDLPFYATGAIFDKFELLGFNNAAGDYVETDLYRCFTQGGVMLFDECAASAPEALTAFNMALANDRFAFPNGIQTKHPECYFIAADNTDGRGDTGRYNTRQELDGATLDRFTTIEIEYCPVIELSLAMSTAEAINAEYNSSQVINFVSYVQSTRVWCEVEGLDVIISPRKSAAGAARLARGADYHDTIALIIDPLLSDDQKARRAKVA